MKSINNLFPFVLFLIASVSCAQKPKRFTAGDVLWQLDSAFSAESKDVDEAEALKIMREQQATHTVHYTFFLDLEHGYCETAGSKIHLYADSTRWAIVFEKTGYENRGGDAISELDYFGNCLTPVKEVHGGYTEYSNMDMVELISGAEYEKICNKTGTDMETFEKISPDAKVVNVRGRLIPIEHDLDKYLKLGILPDSDDNPHKLISYGGLVRYLTETKPSIMYAAESDIRKYLPPGLPKIMTIDRFHFESSYNKKNLPGLQETYQLIAKILVARDSTLWRPKEKPNNHWSNWESGNL